MQLTGQAVTPAALRGSVRFVHGTDNRVIAGDGLGAAPTHPGDRLAVTAIAATRASADGTVRLELQERLSRRRRENSADARPFSSCPLQEHDV